MLESASSFSSEQYANGVVAIVGKTLRIFVIDKLGNSFNQQSIPLKYTPRRFIFHPEFKMFIVIESDHNCFPQTMKEKLLKERLTDPDDMEDDGEGYLEKVPAWMRDGPVKTSEPGNWASCLRIIHPYRGETSFMMEFEENEAAFR